jgi:hypothetical protein
MVSMTEARIRRSDRWPGLRSDYMESRQLRPVAGTLTLRLGIPFFRNRLLNLWTRLKSAVT